jgi:hypothetical protein
VNVVEGEKRRQVADSDSSDESAVQTSSKLGTTNPIERKFPRVGAARPRASKNLGWSFILAETKERVHSHLVATT